VDYLLKPFDEERLHESIDRARQRIAATTQEMLAQRLEALLHAQAPKTERLVVRNGDRYEFVSIESIDWIESANNFVELHCGPKHYLLGETLTGLEGRLDSAGSRESTAAGSSTSPNPCRASADGRDL